MNVMIKCGPTGCRYIEGDKKMRVVKEANMRKSEILDVAEQLFVTKGFDGTSTTDILNEIGIARGTLYYHFKSKEDILDAMIERMTGNLVVKASEIAGKKDMPVLQRLTRMMLALNVNNALGHEDVYKRKISAFIYNLERLLGMERDSLREAILLIFR